jgi:hypothetical protein
MSPSKHALNDIQWNCFKGRRKDEKNYDRKDKLMGLGRNTL